MQNEGFHTRREQISLPLHRGGGTKASFVKGGGLRQQDGGIVKTDNQRKTIPQSASLTAPFTKEPLISPPYTKEPFTQEHSTLIFHSFSTHRYASSVHTTIVCFLYTIKSSEFSELFCFLFCYKLVISYLVLVALCAVVLGKTELCGCWFNNYYLFT